MKILKISDWETVDYPIKKLGSAEITKEKYKKGYYLMEGVAGYELYEVKKPITITELRINKEICMVDDPLHWIGMEKLAEHCTGNVLIGGLGLGLILHHLVKNKKVKKTDVVEINKDVIDLIAPLIPNDRRVNIYHNDIFNKIWKEKHHNYDTIVLDVWVKDSKGLKIAGTDNDSNMGLIHHIFRKEWGTKVFVWGHRDRRINPAVEKVSPYYLELVQQMQRGK